MSAALLGSFLAASTLLIIAPGPAMLFILRQCQRHATAPFEGLAGIVVADLVLISLSCLGVATLVTRFPVLAGAIKLAGAGYVAWIGFQTVRKAGATIEARDEGTSSFAQGLAITLSNPKAILFFAAFFPLFTRTGTPAGEQFIRLGFLFECVNVALYCLFITGSRYMLGRAQALRSGALNRVCGGGLVLAGSVAAVVTIRELV
jgi:leucine efflux protein